MSNTGDVPSNETIELFTPQNSNHDESGAVDSNLSSTFELSNKSDKTINGTEVQLINSTTERFNMTGPITNGTEVQLINSTTERFNMTGPITNGTEVQLINSTDLLNLNNTMFNQTGTNPLSNISSVDRESLSASLVDSESDTAFKVNLLSYSVNNSELKVSELGKEIDFSLNNSAKVKLTPLNSSTDLEVSAMKLTGENGTNTILNNPENSKWVIDAPAGVYSLFIDAKYFPGNQNVQYGATIKVGGKKNLLPVADAGEDRVVNGNISVILDGTKSADPDGSISSYHWIQVSGEPFVTLAGVDTPHPSFITPSNLRNDSNISFRLLITDNDGANSTDDVNVLIKNTTLLPKVEGTVILEPVPKTLSAGDYYEFKGTLNLTKIADGSYVQIRNGEGSQYDELLTFGPVESGGIFTAPWTAVPREGLLNIYATYTDIGGNVYQSESFPVKVLHFKSNPGAATKDANTSNRPVKAGSNLEPFMEVHYSDWNKDHLNVYILAINPSAQGSIGKAKNAVSDLSKIVKQETGNNAAWNFNIFATNGFPSPIQTATHPINILFSLSSIDDSVACGYNHILQRKKSEFTSNEVFTSSRCGDVYKSTMHEFLHSLGLGHTWHEVDDMMCSTEWFLGTNKWTCDNDVDPYNDHNKPTEFNVRALVHTYGNNGFQEPNANIREDYDPGPNVKYYCTPLPCEPHIANVPPVADAGISQSSKVGTKVILDGSGDLTLMGQ